MGRASRSDNRLDPIYAYYEFVKSKPCCICGAPQPTEAAHIRGMISPKTGLVMPRSHKTVARWICIPLCKECHTDSQASVHAVGEEAFNEARGKNPHYIWMVAASLLAEFNEERLYLRIRKPQVSGQKRVSN